MRDLAGKTAFVSGGASGIGLALGYAFAEAGMRVMLADIAFRDGDSAAAEANLQQGDQILEINHKKIGSADEFATIARQTQKDKSQALLLVQRGNATLYTVINPQG